MQLARKPLLAQHFLEWVRHKIQLASIPLKVGQTYGGMLRCRFTVGAAGSRWVAKDEVLRATKAAERKSDQSAEQTQMECTAH